MLDQKGQILYQCGQMARIFIWIIGLLQQRKFAQ